MGAGTQDYLGPGRLAVLCSDHLRQVPLCNIYTTVVTHVTMVTQDILYIVQMCLLESVLSVELRIINKQGEPAYLPLPRTNSSTTIVLMSLCTTTMERLWGQLGLSV